MTDRLERSAAFWLRAYPPTWRAQRADEVTAVLVDLAPDGARRLDVRTALGLLRGGVATRWRQTPPPHVYLAYRLFDVRVPTPYREWVRQDITGPGSLRRNLMGRLWLLAFPLWNGVAAGFPTATLVWWATLAVVLTATLLLVRPDAAVRRRLQRHARRRTRREPHAVGGFVWVRQPRERTMAEPGARVLVVLLAAGALAWSAAAVLAPTRLGTASCGAGCVETVTVPRDAQLLITAPLTAAAVVGLVVGIAVARRFRRLLAVAPDQPARRLVGTAPHAGVAVALWTGLIVAAALAEATGVWALSLSAVAAPVCLFLLPTVFAAWRHARVTDGLAFVDLRHVAWTNRPVEVERYDTDLVPDLTPAVALESR
ncbi:hypothetical protein [Cellulomonas sp. Leaf334]|uniref:hypothetical protein n=1 Tax=Cellulomonas sp. Leaf334 TaxID=1736339 RepID=UPI0006FDFC7B|nr:hypothetical protein [Cellulomonas sp. Leaf334]KQR08341.1 hypothetical protein ASF78_18830 [Cellulomonas sp. Leaf334]